MITEDIKAELSRLSKENAALWETLESEINPLISDSGRDGYERIVTTLHAQYVSPPPWIIYADGDHDIAILPAGRPGEVAKLDGVPRAVATEVVQSVNQNRMSVAQALDVIAYHRSRR